MLAIPCNSFSAARRAPIGSAMPRRLRSNAHPFFLPGLCDADRRVAETGNRIVRACASIVRACQLAQVPWIIENPRSSFLWKMPAMQRLAAGDSVRIHHCHQCQYSCPWMKPTTFMTGHCQSAPQLERSCHPVKRCGLRMCSKSGEPHFVLSGPGVTKQAQTYSHSLASALTSVFREAWICKHYGHSHSAISR